MKKKKYFTTVYLDGKRVKVKDCKKLKGFNSIQNDLRAFAGFPGCSVSQTYNVGNKKMKVTVYNRTKNSLFG